MICCGSSLAQLKPKSFRIHEFFLKNLLLSISLLTRHFKLIYLSTGFSDGVFTAVDAYPQQYPYSQQYSGQYGSGNQQATVENGNVVQQTIGQIWSFNPPPQSPPAVYYPTNRNP
ncbi:GSCOCT00014260001.2-RA-CDS [Cotesia congregata]|uniref:Cc_single_20.3 n=1 Tax=Cotesia congregata TaxID=51543 RepID=S6CWF9_COTCN|nr:GSCOCT00014260001.2-RA-CDS [Cotesia congregata]CAG5092371.1 cc_single_20.3 [Cotesia congregata]CCQ71114.1 hypothetical protein CcBV_20.3 [Cotesia congregata]